MPTTPGELGDLMLIDKGPLGPKQSPLSVLPYYGRGFYGRAATAFMLDAGIVTWSEIKETFIDDSDSSQPIDHTNKCF